MKVIGVTGGVGAGKSKVLEYLNDNSNCRIIYSDNLAKDLEKKNKPCYQPIVELLGEDILGEDGEIVPKLMAAKIYAAPDLLEKVNNIIHPQVKIAIISIITAEKLSGKIDYLFIEAALLIECGYKSIVDEMWYIRADDSVRRKRLKESRGYSDEKITQILSSQLSDEEFMKNSDVIIDNSNDIKETYKRLNEILSGEV